jgi:hypothetical protein
MAYNSISDVHPQEGKQEQAFRMLGSVDFMLWGGARFGGKSELLSMIPLTFCDDSAFRGIFFRRQYDEIMGANGLWEKAENQYKLFNARPLHSRAMWQFPSGARQFYRHMFTEENKETHRGKGYSLIGFDEIDKFSKEQVTFLLTCLRSEAKMDSFCVGTLNPNPDSWCLPLVEWYLDEDGKPREDRCGVIRYFVVYEGEFLFADTSEWFSENRPETVHVDMPDGSKLYTPPKTFSYVFFNIFDNPLGILTNPRYLSELNNLPDHERDSQLYGNWYSRPRAESLWQRQWVRGENGERVIKGRDIPEGCTSMRGVDKAHSLPTDANKTPDYTALSPKIEKSKEGLYYLSGNYHPDIKDPDDKHGNKLPLGRFRKLAGERDTLIAKQAVYDGKECSVVLTKDSGAGKGDHTYTLAKLVEKGISVVEDATSSTQAGKKVKDFLPFANACQLGLVFIAEDTFHPDTLKAFYSELEKFDGERSTRTKKDDWCDAAAMTFNAIAPSKVHKITVRNQKSSKSLVSDLLNSKMKY